jgi:hypothetical protein
MTDESAPGPEPPRPQVGLRDAVVSYVRAMHEAFLAAGGGQDPARGLAAGPFTVVAAAGRSLHLIATRNPIAAPRHGAVDCTAGPLSWTVVFVDPTVEPTLGDVPAGPDEIAAVRDALAVEQTLYHLVVGPGAAMTPHHATHTGTGLAHRELAGQ